MVPGELVQAAPVLRGEALEDMFRIAKGLAMSGMFPDARHAEQAFAKILIGRDLGLSPTQAMTGIHIVEGKPQLAAVTLGAFVRRVPGYDFRVLELSDEKCALEFTRDGEVLGVSEFTMDDARRAGLVKDKSGWVKYPRNMLYARAMSNGVKWYAPDATHGVPVYHEGEIEPQHYVDGEAAAEAQDEAADVWGSLDDALEDLPPQVRERLRVAYEEAQRVRPGQVTPAVVRMSVKGQPIELVERYIADVEGANALSSDKPSAVRGVGAEVLRQRLEMLQQARTEDLNSHEADAVDEEIAHIEGQLAEGAKGVA